MDRGSQTGKGEPSSAPVGPAGEGSQLAAEAGRQSASGWRQWAWPAVQGAITIAVLAWIFADPTLRREMAGVLMRADLCWLAAGLGLGGVWVTAGVVRWRMFLLTQGIELGFGRALGITLIGMFFILFVPGAMSADAVRIFYAIRHRPDKKTAVAVSVIMDRLAGLMALMLVAVALTFSRWQWFTASAVSTGTLYFLAGFLGLSVGGLALAWLGVRLGLLHRLPAWAPRRAWLIEFAEVFAGFLQRGRLVARATAVSLVVLLGYFLTFYCAARAFDAGVGLWTVLSIMPVVDVISALPLTISGLGVREELFASLLGSLAETPREVAVLISLTGFGLSAAWSLVGGVVFPLYRSTRAGDAKP